MAQVSFWWQQFFNSIDRLVCFNPKSRTFKRRYPQELGRSGSWFVGLVGVVAMLFWNWKLLLATGTGVLVMVLVYLMQEWDWSRYGSSLRRLFTGSNRQLTIAVIGGGIATLSTYMMVSIWIDPHSSWIIVGAIVQGCATLATLGLLVWQLLSHQGSRDEIKQDQMLGDLTDTEPLKRLLAVRQLTRYGTDSRLHPSKRRQIVDCFCLMLSREPEPVIRDAILEGLQLLENNPRIDPTPRPLQIPITLESSEVNVPHH